MRYGRDVVRGAPERGLNAGERAAVPEAFARALDLDAVRLVDRAHNPFALGKILVRGDRIHWPGVPVDLARHTSALSTLMHELAHVWQYRTGRLSAAGYLLQPANWRYRYAPGLAFDGYGVEAQADIIEDWCRVQWGRAPRRFADAPPTRDWLEGVVPFGRSSA